MYTVEKTVQIWMKLQPDGRWLPCQVGFCALGRPKGRRGTGDPALGGACGGRHLSPPGAFHQKGLVIG